MIKFIIPGVIIFLIVLFWEKINKIIRKKFNFSLNYLIVIATLLLVVVIYLLVKNWFMDLIDFSDVILSESDGVFTLKNNNTTLGFVRFNNEGEVEYIFVNPIFRKKNLAKKLLKLVKEKTHKKIIFQKPISPLGSKLLKSIEKWN